MREGTMPGSRDHVDTALLMDMERLHTGDHDDDDGVGGGDDVYPMSVIVTGVDGGVFVDEMRRHVFEAHFRQFDPEAEFAYLRSFRRAKINFSSPDKAAYARCEMHRTEVCGAPICCYFAQPIQMEMRSGTYLQPPPLEKQFLISPPASPPVGWEPQPEGKPIMNYDLLNAIVHLAPGQAHELHPQSDTHPGIVVHVCEDLNLGPKVAIEQTKCPDRR